MAQFTISIPDDKVALVKNSFAIQYNRPDEIDDPDNPDVMIPNPVSKVQFAKNIIRSFIREVVRAAQVRTIEVQRQQIIVDADANTELIEVN